MPNLIIVDSYARSASLYLNLLIAEHLPRRHAEPVFNFSYRKVGGLRFVKLGRLNLSFSLSKR